jgi:hypothetical protein
MSAEPTPVLTFNWDTLVWVIGLLSPKVIAYLQNPLWDDWKKWAVNIGFHIVVSFVYLGASGIINWDDLKTSAAAFAALLAQLVVLSALSYAGLWKPKFVNERAAAAKKGLALKLGLVKANPESPASKPLDAPKVTGEAYENFLSNPNGNVDLPSSMRNIYEEKTGPKESTPVEIPASMKDLYEEKPKKPATPRKRRTKKTIKGE